MAKYLVQECNNDTLDVHGWKRIEAERPEWAAHDYLRVFRAEGPIATQVWVWCVGEKTHSNGNPCIVHGYDGYAVSIRLVQ